MTAIRPTGSSTRPIGPAAPAAPMVGIAVANVAPYLFLDGSDVVIEGQDYTLYPWAYDFGDDTISSWTIDWGDDLRCGLWSTLLITVFRTQGIPAVSARVRVDQGMKVPKPGKPPKGYGVWKIGFDARGMPVQGTTDPKRKFFEDHEMVMVQGDPMLFDPSYGRTWASKEDWMNQVLWGGPSQRVGFGGIQRLWMEYHLTSGPGPSCRLSISSDILASRGSSARCDSVACSPMREEG